MDNGICSDLECGVEYVDDYHGELTQWAAAGWDAVNTGGRWKDIALSREGEADEWRECADNWRRTAKYAMDTARLGLWILIAVGAVAAILIIVKVLQ